MTHEIRGGITLPARREDVELRTSDGLVLVGELALPLDREPTATLVTLHPLPTHGGFMDSHVLRKAAARLPALAGLAVLRFNTRGTSSPRGTSDGAFGDGVAERADVAAAMRFVAERGLPHPWLVGWSFGTELAVKWGREHPIEGAILLSPPLHRASAEDVAAWAADGRPLVALIPEFDDYLRPEEAAERFASVPQLELVAVEGGKHLWVGESQTRRVLDEIVRVVAPESFPLPSEWEGELD
ncbi:MULTISPECIES: alpha/beta hydrolase [unclassified Rathayibacter]|uniref:alpha/beta hydrolase n=1 Tax=unclassified Rathayibacter TaxID=2609250 RepID=UPI00188C9F94|nr:MULTISPECIES: alpha/beta fold hydrolase [unclassified Rathayibacter]MBF4462183.1 alpha/beta fold hydrolase [Rathayibacter sp. VKM Ac-2879]MBF4503774.1 alpha/beta fold hydrolase [Rathayibacter sp. VKM Ac-2878]